MIWFGMEGGGYVSSILYNSIRENSINVKIWPEIEPETTGRAGGKKISGEKQSRKTEREINLSLSLSRYVQPNPNLHLKKQH